MDYARELYARSIKRIGEKKWQAASGLTLTHIYRCMRDPNDPDVLEAAVRTEYERLDLMFDLLAADPDNKPILIEWDELFTKNMGRRIRHERQRAVSHADVVGLAAKCCREHGEAMGEALTEGEDARALHEATELMACVQELVAALSARVDAATTRPIRRVS